ncbi:unnamed protein product [Pseudo-nitzschia multistriata]|uniref:FAS1 domain-containing protein n=1 Tax=Pseudo-nitzschia multistriata TaxID=183589 RepID=A0A448YV55_9STRA|nr:unnamed protein product [Pseudo-nitzschia multistriata]
MDERTRMLNTKSAVLSFFVSAIGWTLSEGFTTTPFLQHQYHPQRCAAGFCSTVFAYDDGSYNQGSYEEGTYDDGSYSDGGYAENNDLLLIREFLQNNYPDFYTILDKNEEIWKAIGDTEEGNEPGFTVFVPSVEALQNMDVEKQNQLLDERNLETIQKIAAYHVIGEPVTSEALFEAGGVLTVGGEVPIERSVTGGFFGFGGTEDGGVTLNSAKILRSASVGQGLVHEVDNLVSPSIMWRYMDQLRIPGSS